MTSYVETTVCTLCGESSNTPYRFEEFETQDGHAQLGHNHCTCCGMRYVSPRLNSIGLDYLYNERYETDTVSGRYNVDDHVSRGEYDSFERYVRDQFSEGGDFLDVGCGVGMLLVRFSEDNDFQFDGVEYSEHAAETARARANNLFVGSLTDLSIPDDAYDGVTCLYVLEHVPDPLVMLQEMHRVCKPNGLLFAAVPNYRYLKIRSDNAIVRRLAPDSATLHAAEHLQNFNPETFTTAIRKVGFSVESIHFAEPLNTGSFPVRMAKKVARLPASALARLGYGLGGIHVIARKT